MLMIVRSITWEFFNYVNFIMLENFHNNMFRNINLTSQSPKRLEANFFFFCKRSAHMTENATCSLLYSIMLTDTFLKFYDFSGSLRYKLHKRLTVLFIYTYLLLNTVSGQRILFMYYFNKKNYPCRIAIELD